MNYAEAKWFDKAHRNKRGFVLGGGPSILQLKEEGFDFSLLKDEITIGTNVAYNLFVPNYLIWMDKYFWDNFGRKTRTIDCVKFCPDHIMKSCKIEDEDIYAIRRWSGQGSDNGALTESFSDPMSFWNNSGVAALRIAYMLGLRPIYLVGVDLTKTDGKGNTHFHKEYEKQRVGKTGILRYGQFYRAFERTIKALKKRSVRVYSCSPISELNNVLKVVDIKELLH